MVAKLTPIRRDDTSPSCAASVPAGTTEWSIPSEQTKGVPRVEDRRSIGSGG